MKRFIPNIKYFLFAIIMVCLFIPMFQQLIPQMEEVPLSGKVIPAEDTKFSWNAWYAGRYQKKKGDYLKENFGYRTDFVRFYNEVQYSMYGTFSAPNIYEGEDGYLFRFYLPNYNFLSNFKGTSYYREKVEKLEQITKKLEEQGVTLVFAIIPGKHSYHRNELPERNKKGMYSDSSNYKVLRKSLKGSSANWLDVNQYFENLRGKMDYPLYAKGGIHWTRMGCFEGLREIMNFASEVSGKEFTPMTWTKPVVFTWNVDTDITNILNLRRTWDEHQDIMFADLINDESEDRPNVLVISDSYFDAPYWARVPEKYWSDDFNYWYYNKACWDGKYVNTLIDKKKTVEDTKDRDVIIIMSTLMNLENLGWGFIEDVYNADYPEVE